MARAGAVVARAHEAVAEAMRPGMTTLDLDRIAEKVVVGRGRGAVVQGLPRLPCDPVRSVNDEVVHGIPSADRVLREGDVVSVDCGAVVDGFHGDAAVTWVVGGAEACDQATSALIERHPRGDVGGAAGVRRRQPTRRHQRRDRGRRHDALAGGVVRATPATGRVVPCTRTPASPTTAGRVAGCGWAQGWCWPSSRCSPSAPRGGRGARRRLDGGDARRVHRGALGAHGRDHAGRPVGPDRPRDEPDRL